jgi:linoleoyl-CoA desaturase
MKVKKINIVSFAPKGHNSFLDTVAERAKAYFETHNISPYANAGMWVKTIIMLTLYFAPIVLIITGVASVSGWLFFGLWFIMAIGLIGIGTSVMHDANHGTYSANKKVNRFIGYVLEAVGGFSINWKIQHNVLHHTYTNIDGLDEDIESVIFLRLSPRQPLYWFHKYQFLYIWFFYSIMTLYWMTAKDFVQVFRYKRKDLLIKQRTTLKKAVFSLTLYKIFYYGYIIVLPILFSGMPWYYVIFGFMLMHFVTGLFLSCVFQPAHVMETSGYAAPVVNEDSKHRMEDTWAIHEMENTANFAPKNRILSWFIGGLNFQIEHHLFTRVCHVHYRKLAPIVQQTAREFNIPYHVQPTFRRALWEHAKMLKKLGRQKAI